MTKKTFTLEYEEFDTPSALAVDEQDLIDCAWMVRKHAYAPYSNFKVGAAVQTTNDNVHHGSNQENANYKGTCAERAALDAAGSSGLRASILKIAIVGGPDPYDIQNSTGPEDPITPCGQCRQDIKEVEDLAKHPITIIMASRNRIRRVTGIKNLLPFAFGPSNLGITIK